MKSLCVPLLLQSVSGATLRSQASPISRIVKLITELKAGIQSDGMKEQQSYDKYACWCEKTLARKAKAISDEKDLIEKMQNLILKLKGDLGSRGAEIVQLKKEVGENKEEQKEASEVRKKENVEYETSKNENEQCIGALESAIKVLTGAGQGKGFLQTMQQAQLLSVVGGVREVLSKTASADALSENDAEAIRQFVQNPEDFMTKGTSALQVGGPFGDYAPQSSQISGILKGMYDSFTSNLEKDNGEESDKQKAFEEFMGTKKQELETLEETLEKQENEAAQNKKDLAESTTTRDDTKEQLEADEQFFEDTKAGCKVKAREWSERSRLRSEELVGVNQAIEILTSPDARQTFESSATTFLQVSAKQPHRAHAFQRLQTLAAKYQSQDLSLLATKVKSSGHFDKLFVQIDEMISDLRKEEQEDIAHRDRCEASENKNKNDLDDQGHDLENADAKIKRLGDKAVDLKATISSLKGEILKTEKSMQEILDMRNAESKQFKKALQDDAAAIAVIEKAIVAMSAFYKNNKIPLELVQKKSDPDYTVDPDKAPETTFDGGDYGGRKSEGGGIIAILEMVKEDTANEMKESRKDEADAQDAYENDRASQQDTLDAQKKSKMQADKELAGTEEKIADTQEAKSGHAADMAEEQKLQGTLANDCAWVKTHFKTRRDKRKNEIDGLMEAKNYLAGSGIDDDLD